MKPDDLKAIARNGGSNWHVYEYNTVYVNSNVLGRRMGCWARRVSK